MKLYRGFIGLGAVLWILAIGIYFLDPVMGFAAPIIVGVVSLMIGLALFEHWKLTRWSGGKLKMYCLCSKEALDKMKGVRGKMITQGGHAYLHSAWDAEARFPSMARAYRNSKHAYKITLVVPTEADLKAFHDRYRNVCGVSLVVDAGFTVFKNEDGSPCPTVTFLGIGPIPESLIGDDLKALKTLS